MKKSPVRKRSVRPDTPDFRDLPFRPNIALAPQAALFPDIALGVKNQLDTSACTGFSLSLVVEYLLRKARREATPEVSPYMLYSMARRYDEFPGSRDEGSSLRGALKGWQKHGACAEALWKTGIKMPPAPKNPKDDWWLDAVNRPLGAYYRIDPKQITDIHAALNEVGIVYASTDTHAGWDKGNDLKRKRPTSYADKIFTIPAQKGGDGGHAIAFVGYNDQGFLIQNSWDTGWGTGGYAILTYEDWTDNAMDCWVAQLGVVTQDHKALAVSNTLRTDARGRVALAASTVLRNREVSPFVVDMGNNGQLSNSGLFRTTEDDLRAIVDVHLVEARKRWNLGNKPINVCIYAHGGLVGEKDAAANAAEWIPMLYDNQIFPIYLMWETDLMNTVLNRLSDAIRDVPRPAGAGEGFWSRAERWWNERLERLLAKPGTQIWGEMKQNAAAISGNKKSGAVLLYNAFANSAAAKQSVRFHLVGHSAGSIVHAHIIDALADKLKFESVSFLAPAVRHDTFDRLVRPRLTDGTIKRYQQFHLTDKAEEDDPTCGAYKRSLLYLVSGSFESIEQKPPIPTGEPTPILGMEKYFDPKLAKLKNVTVHVSPGRTSTSTTHGGFDNDGPTKKHVVKFIKQ
ncbi:MAG: C1 family peptidase [Gammaproteobacteria bacterium]|nr:C1 family peptidase [Gammaproteobacteria bacterium]